MSNRLEITSTLQASVRRTACVVSLLVATSACGESPFSPDERVPTPITPEQPAPPEASASSYSEADVQAEGTVTDRNDGFRVQGALHLNAGNETFTFAEADLEVKRSTTGAITSISGTAQVPAPHDNVGFTDPVQADVGMFSGRWLNENRDFNIKLKDNRDYFVFNARTKLEMQLKGDDGQAVSIGIGTPLGGQILFIMDYRDPMFYVYGASDLFGDSGFGWSLNSRIPFEPRFPVQNLGYFDGRNIRTGSMPLLEAGLASINLKNGVRVDNSYLPTWLIPDPNGMGLGVAQIAMGGYQVGFNGTLALELGIESKKKVRGKSALSLGVTIPLAHGSGGMRGDLTTSGFSGDAYITGTTSKEVDWIPVQLLSLFPSFDESKGMQATGFIKSNGDFGIDISGDYSLMGPGGASGFSGAFHFGPEELSLGGTLTANDQTFGLKGAVWNDSAGIAITTPQAWVDGVADDVNEQLMSAVADAEQAWNDVQPATSDYQLELSLRGLRTQLPGIVDRAKTALSNGIANELRKHRGTVYYSSLRSGLNSGVAPYYRELDNLKARANDIRDNDATRRAIEAALRKVASMKTFTYTYRHKVLGVTVKTVTVTRTVMSQNQVNQILNAANNVKHIAATSSRKLQMEQIYNQVNGREIFEKIRGEIKDGVVQIRSIGEFGFVVEHATQNYSMYAVIGGERTRLGEVDIFDVAEMTAELTRQMIAAMTG